MDNGTMMEVFKYLNYCQLAKKSLISKRFCDLIRTHRHTLALLYVSYIGLERGFDDSDPVIKTFNKVLSSKAYNIWLIRNNYSKQISHNHQINGKENTHYDRNVYRLKAEADCKDPNSKAPVFYARTKFNHENWPLFQHFIRLLSDPFIYIRNMELTSQKEVFTVLVESISTHRKRLLCDDFILNIYGNIQKLISCMKDYVLCNEITIFDYSAANHDEQLLDFFMNGAYCTSAIEIWYCDLSEIVFDIVQKFMDLKNLDEYQAVHSIECNQFVNDGTVQKLKSKYAKLMVKEVISEEAGSISNVFEFVNNAIEKKCVLTATMYDDDDYSICYLFQQ